MNKKLIALALVILAVLSTLTACTNNSQNETTPATTTANADADVLNLDNQFKIIAQTNSVLEHRDFEHSGTPEAFYFAVTDLDNDGILDIITSACVGSGLFTESSFFEVNEKGHGINSCNPAEINRSSEPDLIVDSTPCYVNNETGERFFVFTDVVRASASEITETTGWYTFRDNRLVYEAIAVKTISGDTTTYKSSTDDEAITEEDFTNAAENYFSEGYTLKTATFGWTPFVTENGVKTTDLSKEEIEKILIASYEGFSV